MSKHIEIAVDTNSVWSEYVADVLLERLACSGVVTGESEYKHDVMISSSSLVKGYFWVDEKNPFDVDKIQATIDLAKAELASNGVNINNVGSWKLSFKEIADEEWAHSWKKYWHPQRITDKITISPSWEDYKVSSDELLITLDPGIAFGTGSHPTTKLCIKAIEDFVKINDCVADIGMGSGILSIVAAKLGAKKVVGVDNDASVIDVATENALINDVSELCFFKEGVSTDVDGQYDVVVANILAEVLIEIMETFVPLVKTGGKLILSGIIERKANDVRLAAENNGFQFIQMPIEGDWVAIICEKK
jgi:ribosomal protein L11 methyltransferase